MKRALQFSALLGLLLIASQADARGGGGGGSGFRGGGFGFHAAPIVPGRNGFLRQTRQRIPFSLLRFRPRRLDNLGFWPGWWDGQWWPNDGYQMVAPPPAAEPVPPQVIVIRTGPDGRTTSENAPDYGYVAGCHAIPNGYHCDASGTPQLRAHIMVAAKAGEALSGALG